MLSTSQIRLESLTESLNGLGKPVMDTGRDLWLAGLGALALVRQESAKIAVQGVKMFDELVLEGQRFEQKTSRMFRKETGDATSRIAEVASKAARTIKQDPMTFHLLPSNEDWVVRAEGSDEDLSLHDTKEPAVEAARGIARAHEPSRLVVHRADGTIQASYTY